MTHWPNVVFIGPIKTGTTWIYDYLSELQDVTLPVGTKETFFFDRNFAQGPAIYSGVFPDQTPHKRIEVSPSYGGKREALENIHATVPDAHIVITLREPVARTISQYWHSVRYGYFKEPLEAYLQADHSLLVRSNYPRILSDAVEIFGKSNVSILRFEELKEDPQAFCLRVCNLVGAAYVPPSETLLKTKSNEKKTARFAALSSFASWVSDRLKKAGLHSISSTAKRLGLRKLLERKPKPDEQFVSDSTRQQIAELMDFDYAQFVQDAQAHIPASKQ